MPARTGREYIEACANSGAKCGCSASASRTSPPLISSALRLDKAAVRNCVRCVACG